MDDRELQQQLNFRNEEIKAEKYEDQYLSRLGSHFSIKFNPEGRGVLPLGLGPLNTDMCVYFGIETDQKRWALPLHYSFVFNKNERVIKDFELERTMNSVKLTGANPGGLEMVWKFISPFYPQNKKLSTAPFFYVRCYLKNTDSVAREVKIRGGLEKSATTSVNESNNIITQDIEVAANFRGPEVVPGRLCHYQMALAAADTDRETITTSAAIWKCLTKRIQLSPGETKEFEFIFSNYLLDSSIVDYQGQECSFYYQDIFKDNPEVINYAREKKKEILRKSKLFSDLFEKSSLPDHIKKFIYWNFHIYLGSTWLLSDQEGNYFYTNYEGGARYFSTIDVEYNLAGFYGLFWPQFISDQLQIWAEIYSKGNSIRPHKFGPQYRIMEHDVGAGFKIDEQHYIPGPMPVEENSNYILLHYLYYMYTGDGQYFKRHKHICLELADYIIESDVNDNGLPDKGTNNTLDSFEKLMKDSGDQIFLGIKAVAALEALTILLQKIDIDVNCEKYQRQSRKIFKSIEEKGWLNDHYVITINDERPEGWKQPTPLTTNGLAYLLFTGQSISLSKRRIKKDIQLTSDDYTIWPSMGIWRDLIANYFNLSAAADYDFRPDFRGDMYPRSFNSVMSIQTYPGITINIPENKINVNCSVAGEYPLPVFADWKNEIVPWLKIEDGEIEIKNKTEKMKEIDINPQH